MRSDGRGVSSNLKRFKMLRNAWETENIYPPPAASSRTAIGKKKCMAKSPGASYATVIIPQPGYVVFRCARRIYGNPRPGKTSCRHAQRASYIQYFHINNISHRVKKS